MSGRIVVHSLDHARAAVAAAAALGTGVTLVSAPGAGAYVGPGWFRAMVDEAAAGFPGTPVTAVIDCGDEPGTALAALRAGFRRVIVTTRADARARLDDIAAAMGAIIEAPDGTALDLLAVRDCDAACREFLARTG